MNCYEFWEQLPRAGNDLTKDQTDHLAGCAACEAQWASHRVLAAGLQTLGGEWRKTDAPSRLEAGVLAAFRAQNSLALRQSAARAWWTPVVAWASAAAATVALATLLFRGYQPSATKPDSVAAPHRTIQLASGTVLGADSDDDAAVLGEGFVHLPNAPRIEPTDDYNVVRVEVPGSAMIDAGIALAEDRAGETVVADVALGPDGTPRAVRLVSAAGTN